MNPGATSAGLGGGRLVVVSTPIGNLGDLAPRAARALEEADVVACEDTRRTGRLLQLAGLRAKRLVSLHEHNEMGRAAELVGSLLEGATVALVSDAGTPGVSDPGERLVAAAVAAGVAVTAVPGPSAVLCALVVSGLPAERFRFEGFLPRRGAARDERLAAISSGGETSVCYEAPGRVAATLADLSAACGAGRRVAVCRELTKLHEEVWRGTLGEAASRAAAAAEPRGEHVLVVAGAPAPRAAGAADVAEAMERLRAAGLSGRDARKAVRVLLGAAAGDAYAGSAPVDPDTRR